MNEAGRAFTTFVSTQLDVAKYDDNEDTAKIADKIGQLLTPIAKAFVTDTSFEMTVIGQQVFGGHGYIREWGQEQLVRDTRITQIYEGTNGIQALDLIGRKVAMDKGVTANALAKEILAFIKENEGSHEKELSALSEAVDLLSKVTVEVVTAAMKNPNELGAASNEYLHLFGYVMYGYMWARMMVAAENITDEQLKQSKLKTGKFFFSRLLPRIHSLKAAIDSGAEHLYMHSVEDF